MSLDIFNKH